MTESEALKSSFIIKVLEFSENGVDWRNDFGFSITCTKISQLSDEEQLDLYSVFHWDQFLQ